MSNRDPFFSHRPMIGEYYVDFDEDSKLFCIFHTESSHAFESYFSEEEANQALKIKIELLKFSHPSN